MTRRHTTRMIAAALTVGLLASSLGTARVRAAGSMPCSGLLCVPYFMVPPRIAGTSIKFIGWARNYEYAGTAGVGYRWLHYTLDPAYSLPSYASSIVRSEANARRGLRATSPYGKQHLRFFTRGAVAGEVECPAPFYHWMCQAYVVTAIGYTLISVTVDSRRSSVAQARAVAIALYLRAQVQKHGLESVQGW